MRPLAACLVCLALGLAASGCSGSGAARATASTAACRPSPADAWGKGGSGAPEIRGTLAHGSLWALLFPPPGLAWPNHRVASFGRALGEYKIVWRMTGSGPLRLVARGPGGLVRRPVWGPQGHGGSNWDRPGDEWGAGFAFRRPGCWRIEATRGSRTGAVSLLLRRAGS